MAGTLEHRQIQEVVMSLADARIVNLDSPIRQMLEPISSALAKSGVGGEVALHVLCCNEYALVTGLTAGSSLSEIRQLADAIKSSMLQGQTR